MAGQDADTQTEVQAVPALGELPRTVDGVDAKIEDLRQTLHVVMHPQSVELVRGQIDILLERRILLIEAASEGWSTSP